MYPVSVITSSTYFSGSIATSTIASSITSGKSSWLHSIAPEPVARMKILPWNSATSPVMITFVPIGGISAGRLHLTSTTAVPSLIIT